MKIWGGIEKPLVPVLKSPMKRKKASYYFGKVTFNMKEK